MKYAILLVMLLLIASKATATSTIRKELTICPTSRMASWDVTLPSEVSACLSVVVVRADSNYTLMKRRNQPPNQPNEYCTVLVPTRSQDFIWVYTLPGSSASGDIKGELRVGNTGATGARTVVTLACTWTKTGGGTGGGTAGAGTGPGTGGGPQELEGLITGTAMRTSSAVSWQFDRITQSADGVKKIKWTVRVFNSAGQNVNVVFNDVSGDSLFPDAAPWNISPKNSNNQQQDALTGDVCTTTSSKGKLKVAFSGANGSPNTAETTIGFRGDLDIFETAQAQNRIGRDDPRQAAEARNRILIWTDDQRQMVFDLIKPTNVAGPIGVYVLDKTNGENPASTYEWLDANSKTFTFKARNGNEEPDVEVVFGLDLDGNDQLSGTDEIVGTYHVYGVTRDEYANARTRHFVYLKGLFSLANELHRRFTNGEFTAGDKYAPISETTTTNFGATENSSFTHHDGATFAANGFYDAPSGRRYHKTDVTVNKYVYDDAKPAAANLVRNSDELMTGLNRFIRGLSHRAVEAGYLLAPPGETRSVRLSLDGARFNFGLQTIGLGNVTVNSGEVYASSGHINLRVKPQGGSYKIEAGSTVSLAVRDLFDFSYYLPLRPVLEAAGVRVNPPMIQTGYGKPGAWANVGQVGLVQIQVDGAAATEERIVNP